MCAVDADGERRTGGELTIEAPAKVNLRLSVLGVRPDGYHEIDTLMQTVSLSDTLAFRERDEEGLALSVTGRSGGVPTDDENLVLKAARLLERRSDSVPGVEIHLVKAIPPGAGLGGASSDAAAALVGLSRLWGVRLREEELLTLAARVGSDVSFFVRGGTARCTGRGEKVERLSVEGAAHLVLVFSSPLATAETYRIWDSLCLTNGRSDCNITHEVSPVLNLGRPGGLSVWNDLEAAAFDARPGLREVKRSLLSAGAVSAAMSGSGSCVYGVARSAEHAEAIARKLSAGGREAVAVRTSAARTL